MQFVTATPCIYTCILGECLAYLAGGSEPTVRSLKVASFEWGFVQFFSEYNYTCGRMVVLRPFSREKWSLSYHIANSKFKQTSLSTLHCSYLSHSSPLLLEAYLPCLRCSNCMVLRGRCRERHVSCCSAVSKARCLLRVLFLVNCCSRASLRLSKLKQIARRASPLSILILLVYRKKCARKISMCDSAVVTYMYIWCWLQD